MKTQIKIPPSLLESDEKQKEVNFYDPSPFDVMSLTPAERNRYFCQVSSLSGEVPESIQKLAEGWVTQLSQKDVDRFSNMIIPQKAIPRSKLMDGFFSHQLPGIKDSIISDVRRLVKIQDQIKRASELGIKQIRAAVNNYEQLHPEYKAPMNNPGDFATSDSVGNLLEEIEQVKAPVFSSRNAQPSIATILESTDGLTADYSNQAKIE